MTRAQRKDVLRRAVVKLDDASKLLKSAKEELLAKQASELADLVDVLTATHEKAD